MAERAANWAPQSAWGGLPSLHPGPTSGSPGVVVSPRENLGIATVIACGGRESALADRVSSTYGLELPSRPVVATAGGLDLIWAGPQQWLAISEDRAAPERLARELEGLAAVSDQSDGRAVLRLSGPKLRDTMAKGCPVDLHPRAFRPGDTALTAIAHIGVQLWQLDEAPTFEVAVFRSMAGSFWRWLSGSAAEFGLEVRDVSPAAA